MSVFVGDFLIEGQEVRHAAASAALDADAQMGTVFHLKRIVQTVQFLKGTGSELNGNRRRTHGANLPQFVGHGHSPLSGKACIFVEMESWISLLLFTVGILGVSLLLIQSFTKTSLAMLRGEILKQNNDKLSSLKLQAFERLTLYLERNSVPSLIQNFGQNQGSAAAFRAAAVANINEEFNYNLSQQIYVSKQSWGSVKVVREQTLQLLHMEFAKLPADATALDLSQALIKAVSETELPHLKAIDIIKSEIQLLFE
jgi:hypothetical protein